MFILGDIFFKVELPFKLTGLARHCASSAFAPPTTNKIGGPWCLRILVRALQITIQEWRRVNGSVETPHRPHHPHWPKYEGSLMLPGRTSQCTREWSKRLVRVGHRRRRLIAACLKATAADLHWVKL